MATERSVSYGLCGGGLEYLHRRTASRKRRQKWNPVSGGVTGPPCSWGEYKYRDMALQIGGVSDETARCGYEFCGTWIGE
jgi:hypothetical protein